MTKFNRTLKWNLIEIYFKDDYQLLSLGFQTVLKIESLINPTQIYFAHYGGIQKLQIILETDVEKESILSLLKRNLDSVADIKIIDGDGPGSQIHSLGYIICKELSKLDKKTKQNNLGDLFHWAQNMLGFSYQEEEANHLLWAKIAKKNYERQ